MCHVLDFTIRNMLQSDNDDVHVWKLNDLSYTSLRGLVCPPQRSSGNSEAWLSETLCLNGRLLSGMQ